MVRGKDVGLVLERMHKKARIDNRFKSRKIQERGIS